MPSTWMLRVVMVVIAVSFAAAPAHAECIIIPDDGVPYTGPVAELTLAFSGSVTAVNYGKMTVTVKVDRVWYGPVHRETTLFVVPVIVGNGVQAFERGIAYLVTVSSPILVLSKEDASPDFPEGTIAVILGCSGPIPLANAKDTLALLGPGRSPLP